MADPDPGGIGSGIGIRDRLDRIDTPPLSLGQPRLLQLVLSNSDQRYQFLGEVSSTTT